MNQSNKPIYIHASQGGKWTAASAIFTIFTQIAQLAILARLLSPADFGLMSIMTMVVGLANAISDFGIGSFIVQYENLVKRNLDILLRTVIAASLILLAIVLMASGLLASYYQAPELTYLLPCFSLSIVLSVPSQVLLALLQRTFYFKSIALSEIVASSTVLIVSTLIAFAGYGVWALVSGPLVSGAIKTLMMLRPYSRIRSQLPNEPLSNLIQFKSFAFFQTSERVLNYAGWNVDKFIIAKLLGESGLGLYSIAYQLMMRPFYVINPIFTRVSFPIFSSLKQDNDRLASGYIRTIRIIALIAFPIFIFMTLSAPDIILLFAGSQWIEAVPILRILCILGMFFSIGNPIGNLILAKGKPRLSFFMNLLALAVYLPSFAIGARFGVVGVAWGFLLATVLFLFPFEFYVRYVLIRMNALYYFRHMSHLFVAAALPLSTPLVFNAFHLTHLANYPLGPIFQGISSVAFFFSYIYLLDRSVIRDARKIVFPGS